MPPSPPMSNPADELGRKTALIAADACRLTAPLFFVRCFATTASLLVEVAPHQSVRMLLLFLLPLLHRALPLAFLLAPGVGAFVAVAALGARARVPLVTAFSAHVAPLNEVGKISEVQKIPSKLGKKIITVI
jgi:hypothetical protein